MIFRMIVALFRGVPTGRRLLVAVVRIIARDVGPNDGVACYFFSEMEHGSFFCEASVGEGGGSGPSKNAAGFFFSGAFLARGLFLRRAARASCGAVCLGRSFRPSFFLAMAPVVDLATSAGGTIARITT